jgi:hypothetical protein
MKLLFSFVFIFFSFIFFCQENEITSINCFAPKYIGEKVELFVVEDYLTMNEKLVGTSIVKDDSTFQISFFNSKTQKLIIKSNNNYGFIYIEPNRTYNIYLPDRNRYDEYRPLGNQVEIALQDLPEDDINYKILSFERWLNNFLGENFYIKNLNTKTFIDQLEIFKTNVYKAYENDTSFFFKTYVKFSIASIDDIQYTGSKNRYEKYNFYLKNYPVAYENPSYMNYFNNYFKNIVGKLPLEVGNRFYMGILKSSPTKVVNALAQEYTLRNVRILEFVMIKAMKEIYFTNEYPQTNILSILDSLSTNSIFSEHKIIAKNLISKLTEINQGAKAPDFKIVDPLNDTTYTNASFLKKHLYIQFYDFEIKECEKELELLIPLYEKYKEDVSFLCLYKNNKPLTEKQTNLLKKVKWLALPLPSFHPIYEQYKIMSYPTYILIDSFGYVVDFPALKPAPNSKYETIDKTFFYIKKIRDEERKR